MTTDGAPPINRSLSCNSCAFGKKHSPKTVVKSHAKITTARQTPIKLPNQARRVRKNKNTPEINQTQINHAAIVAKNGLGSSVAGGGGEETNIQSSGQIIPRKNNEARIMLPIRVRTMPVLGVGLAFRRPTNITVTTTIGMIAIGIRKKMPTIHVSVSLETWPNIQ